MSKLLVVGPGSKSPDGSRRPAGRRAEHLADRLVQDGHEVWICFPRESGPPAPELTPRHRPLDPRFFEQPEVLRALIEELRPAAVVASSVTAASVAREASAARPLWLDLPDDLLPAADRSRLPGSIDALHDWRRLAPLLDRADRLSCRTAAQLSTLTALLGWRGRLQGEGPLEELVVPLSDAPDDLAGLECFRRWAREPRPAAERFCSGAAREAASTRRLDEVTYQLDAIHRSKMWRLWMAYLGARRILSWPFARSRELVRVLVRSGWDLLTGLLLLGSCGIAHVLARWRRTTRDEDAFAALEPASTREPPELAGRRPRLLIVSPYSIYPPNHGGGVRLYHLVKLLSRHCDLYLLIFIRTDEDPEQKAALEPYCKKVSFHPWRPRFDRPLGTLLPPSALLFRSRRAEHRILDLLHTYRIDVLQLEYTELAQYRRLAGDVPVVLVEHDVAFRSFRRRRQLEFAERFPGSKILGATFADWLRLVRYEIGACRSVEQIHAMSAEDGRFLASFLPDGWRRIRVVPNAVDTAYYRPPEPVPERRGVLMVGNFENVPNLDGFEYFISEIWPRLLELRPGLELTVVGARMPREVLDWDGRDGLRVVGEVPDMRPYYHRHRVLVVPLRAGSGTRLKLFEAFASGIPAVSTTLGAEGIDCADGTHLLIADTPPEFVRAVLLLLDDAELADSISAAAMRLAEERFDWTLAARRNLEGVRELLAARPREDSKPAAEGLEPAGSTARFSGSPEGETEVSVIIPTLNGNGLLTRCLGAISTQRVDRPFEVICVDSGSRAEDLEMIRGCGARLVRIDEASFNHGLTRDLGASLARGRILVFLNQDAIPRDERWLQRLTEPLFADGGPAAVQGGIFELPHDDGIVRRFFWDSCGERFYFTRESRRWISRYHGIGFSTVNAALRRDVWEAIPFGWAPIMEDKKWQREVLEAGYHIEARHEAAVFHTHDYDLPSLIRRCRSEGMGWRFLGEPYTLSDTLRDMAHPRVYRELIAGLARRRARTPAELLFPWIRPWMLWIGNRWSRDVGA